MRTFRFIFIALHIFYSSFLLLYEGSHPDSTRSHKQFPASPTPIPRISTLISRIPIIPTLIPRIPIIPTPIPRIQMFLKYMKD